MTLDAECAVPSPVTNAATPASSLANTSWNAAGSANRFVSFSRSYQNWNSPGVSPVSLPTSNMVTTTTFTFIGGAAVSCARPFGESVKNIAAAKVTVRDLEKSAAVVMRTMGADERRGTALTDRPPPANIAARVRFRI